MIIVGGYRFFGRIELADGSVIDTWFFHLFFLPLVPILSRRTSELGIEKLPLQPRSIGLAYLRGLGLPLGAVLVSWGIKDMMLRELAWGWVQFVIGNALVVGGAAGLSWMGKMRRKTRTILLAHGLTALPLLVALLAATVITAAIRHSS